jgi:hypothetical protein
MNHVYAFNSEWSFGQNCSWTRGAELIIPHISNQGTYGVSAAQIFEPKALTLHRASHCRIAEL